MTDPTTPLPTPDADVNRPLPELLRELAERAGDDGRVTVGADFLDALADDVESLREICANWLSYIQNEDEMISWANGPEKYREEEAARIRAVLGKSDAP